MEPAALPTTPLTNSTVPLLETLEQTTSAPATQPVVSTDTTLSSTYVYSQIRGYFNSPILYTVDMRTILYAFIIVGFLSIICFMCFWIYIICKKSKESNTKYQQRIIYKGIQSRIYQQKEGGNKAEPIYEVKMQQRHPRIHMVVNGVQLEKEQEGRLDEPINQNEINEFERARNDVYVDEKPMDLGCIGNVEVTGRNKPAISENDKILTHVIDTMKVSDN